MPEIKSHRVTITNRLPAAQGFYGLEDHETSPGYDVSTVGAKIIPPGGSLTFTMREPDLLNARKLGEGVTITDAPLASAAPAAAPQPGGKDLPPEADDGARAHENLRPPVTPSAEPTAAALAPQPPAPDQFEGMDDDELRAFITDRDGEAPHHRLGREKLLLKARGQADEAV